ncbi:GL18864 [Drosophila persimilis]|uniref:GL18864 n=2 Tax=Drosophila persimilis TaxID=7234 RepID=B4G8C6_DROPE|nr:GL18864 [Drosophila persimilis]
MSSYRTLVEHGAPPSHLAGGNDISLASTSSPKTLHRMIKYWRNSSGKMPGLRKSESFADYRRHSSNSGLGVGGVGGGGGATGGGGRSSTPSTRYQRLESCDNVCLLATPTTR